MNVAWRKWLGNSRTFWLPCGLYCLVAGMLTVRQSVPLGLGITPDTTAYVKMARDLLENGLADFVGSVGAKFPMGYPLVLAGAGWLTNRDPLEAAVFVNIVLMVLLVLFFMLEARRLPGVSPWLSGLIITFSLPLFLVSAMAWSEILFIFIVFMTLRKAATCDRRPVSLVLLGLLTFFAYITKYIGITLIPVVMVQVFLCSGRAFRQGVKNTAIYLLGSSALIGAYILRSFLVTGTFWATRPPSHTGVLESLSLAQETIVRWFIPEIPVSGLVLWALTLILAGYIWATGHHLLRNLKEHAHWFAVYPAFILVYLVVLSYLASQYAFDSLGIRLASPVYPALAMTLLFLVAPGETRNSTPNLTRVAHWLLVLVLVAQPVRLVFKDTHRRGKEGPGGYNQPVWRNSQMITECLPQLDVTGETVFSNGADVLYILSGINAEFMPSKGYHNSEASTGVTGENIFDRHPRLQGSLLIIFYSIEKSREYLFTLEEMRRMCRLETVVDCRDGAVFRVHGPLAEKR